MNGPMSRVDATATIPVEVASWVTKFVGGDGTGRRVLEEPLTPGATVRSVLAGLSSRYPELAAPLWPGRALGDPMGGPVNAAVRGSAPSLVSPLKPGAGIPPPAHFMGGAWARGSRHGVATYQIIAWKGIPAMIWYVATP